MKLSKEVLLLFISFTLIYAKYIEQSKLKEGDIIFHESRSHQSIAINLATKSKYTHLGIIFKYNNEYKVLMNKATSF